MLWRGPSLKNPWIRLWIVAAIGVSIYWHLAFIGPRWLDYQVAAQKYSFIVSYLATPVNVASRDDNGIDQDIQYSSKLEGFGTCTIPIDVLRCIQSADPRIALVGSKNFSWKAVITDPKVSEQVQEMCGTDGVWFTGWFIFAKRGGTLNPAEQDADRCVQSKFDEARLRQKQDVQAARSAALGEVLSETARLLCAVAAMGFIILAARWIFHGFQHNLK